MENSFLDSLSNQEKANYYSFMSKIERRGRVNTNMSPCWTHSTSSSSSGYGQIQIDKKKWNLHRYSYWIHNGNPELTSKDIVEHLCDNKECSNPEHLKLGNHKTNGSQESLSRVREIKPKKEKKIGNYKKTSASFEKGDMLGEQNNNAKLTWDKVNEIRRRKEAGLKYGELKLMAKEYGIQYITIQKIVAGTLWKIKAFLE